MDAEMPEEVREGHAPSWPRWAFGVCAAPDATERVPPGPPAETERVPAGMMEREDRAWTATLHRGAASHTVRSQAEAQEQESEKRRGNTRLSLARGACRAASHPAAPRGLLPSPMPMLLVYGYRGDAQKKRPGRALASRPLLHLLLGCGGPPKVIRP